MKTRVLVAYCETCNFSIPANVLTGITAISEQVAPITASPVWSWLLKNHVEDNPKHKLSFLWPEYYCKHHGESECACPASALIEMP